MLAVIQAVDASEHPLRGVVHAAMQLDDAPLAELDESRFRTALGPKMQGARVLDDLTRQHELDFFVSFSSLSALIGQTGQANYAAGNLFLEALSRARRHRGAPGQALQLGAVSDIGYVDRSGLGDTLRGYGVILMRPAEALDGLGRLLRGDTDILTVARLDWGRTRRVLPIAETPRMAANLPPDIEGAGHDRDEFLTVVAAATPEKGHAMVERALAGLLATVLQTTSDRIGASDRLDLLGLDSLMRTELLVSIRQQLGCDVPVMEAARIGTVAELAHLLLRRLLPATTRRQSEGTA
jgi:acyl carrier protein